MSNQQDQQMYVPSNGQHILGWLDQAVAQLLPDQALPPIKLDRPTDLSHGDFTTNVAMQLFGQLKGAGQSVGLAATTPRQLAEQLVSKLQQLPDFDPEVVAQIEVAGPGFINFFLTDQTLFQAVQQVAMDQPQVPQVMADQRVNIEFTDPNPFKEFHIGHLYSNVVGESVARLHEAVGAEVRRVCYQGDVGMHVAKSVWGMRQKISELYPKQEVVEALAKLEAKPLPDRIKLLGQAYALGATAYKEDEAAQDQIKNINYLTYLSAQQNLIENQAWQPQVDYSQFVDLESAEFQEVKNLYQTGRAWSLEYFNTMYHRAGMRFDDFFFESIVGEFGVQIVRQHLAPPEGTAIQPTDQVFELSQGAVIFPGSTQGLHDRVFINSLGLPTYEAKELGLAPEKQRRWPHDASIIITGNEIDEYFKVLLKAMSQTHPELAAKTTHLSHGMVKLPEGKMSSRTGQIITGQWLMDEAHQRVLNYLQQNRPEMASSEASQVAETVALGAIKYAFLKSSIGKDIRFSFEESLALTGNSGPYLQYTVVRCKSVLAKAEQGTETSSQLELDQLNPEEKTVAQLLTQFGEVVVQAQLDHAPHLVASYLHQLAQAFSSFYDQHQIVGQPQRLVLTTAVLKTLENGLEILGIGVAEQM